MIPVTESTSTHSPPSLSLSHIWQDRYHVVERLEQGGFGELYLAIDTHHPDQLQCVIKQLKPYTQHGLGSSGETKRRFHREVDALKQLGHHDQIPQLLDQIEIGSELYLVQEFIEGRSLAQELTANTDSARWSESQVIHLLQDVLQVLSFVHRHGMIHRDIKPSNLIRRQSDNRLVLIDFGAIAPTVPDANLAPDQPGFTLAIHSEGYTPIEQLRGKPCPASDLYALGMVAIQALTGLHPREFEESLSLKSITWFQNTQVSAGLIAVLVTMTRRKWSDRYQTAEAALQDLVDLVDCSPDSSPAFPTLSKQKPSSITTDSVEYTPTRVTAPPPPEPTPADSGVADTPNESSTPTPTPHTLHPTPSHSTPHTPTPTPLLKPWKRLLTPRVCSLLIAIGLISSGIGMFLWVVAGWQINDRSSPITDSPTPTKFLLHTLTEDSAIEAIAFTDDQTVIGGLTDSRAVRWDVNSAKSIESFANHFSPVTAVVVSPNGQQLATGSEDRNITLWDLQTGKALHTLRGHRWAVLALAFSPDAKTLVSSSNDQTIRFWHATTGKLLHTLTGFQEPFLSLDISVDGSLLVGGSANNTITVWNASTQKVVRTLRGHSEPVDSVAISPNGAVLASGSADQTVKIWSLYTGKLLHTLTGHSDVVNAVAISPNGQFIVSGSADKTIKVWDLYTGELIHTYRDRTTEVSAISISPDGKTIASAGLDGTVKVWQMPQSEV